MTDNEKKMKNFTIPDIPDSKDSSKLTSLQAGKNKNDYLGKMNSEESYKPFLQGTLTNAFTAVNKNSKHTVNPETQMMLFTPEELGITVTTTENANLSVSTSKTLDIITLLLTDTLPFRASDEKLSRYSELIVYVDKYMKYRGLTDKNQAVKQMKKDFKTLADTYITGKITVHERQGKSYKEVTKTMEIHPLDAIPHEAIRETATVRLSLSFLKYLSQNSQLMKYPIRILIQEKNNSVYYLGKKLAEHFNMNFNKANKDSISACSLLKYNPEIPTLEEEKAKGRHYRARCIEPLEKGLDRLKEIGFLEEWYFTNESKRLLTDKQLADYYTAYSDWKRLHIHFVIKDYPKREIKQVDTKKLKKK